MLKVGFIGAGGRAQDAHYPTIYRMDGVSVQAVCELDTDKLQKVSNKYNIPRTFSDPVSYTHLTLPTIYSV